MCKNLTAQTRAIESAKHETPYVHALYEHTDYGDDLVALVKQLSDFATLICKVNDEGEAITMAIRKPDFAVSKRTVMEGLHIANRNDYKFMRGLYTLKTC